MLAKYFALPRSVHLLCIGVFVNRAGTMVIPFLTLYLTKGMGQSVDFATFAIGCVGLGAISGGLAGGYFADRIGRRPVMLVSLTGTTILLLLFGHLTEPWQIISVLILFAAVGATFRPAAGAMIGDQVEQEDRPLAFGLMYLALNLGMGIGASLGGFLAVIDFQMLFWVEAATTAAFALITFLFITETQKRSEQEEKVTLSDTVRQVSADRPFLIFCLASLAVGLVFMQFMSTLPIHLDHHGIGADGYGWLVSMNCIMVVLCQLPLTAFLNRFHRGSVLVAASVVTGIGYGLIALATGFLGFAGTVVIWTLGELMAVPFISAIVTDMAPERFRARYLGIQNTSFFSAMMLGAPIGGAVLSRYGSDWLWGGAFCFGLLSALLYATIHHQMGPSKKEQ